jgi:hypothetical protein
MPDNKRCDMCALKDVALFRRCRVLTRIRNSQKDPSKLPIRLCNKAGKISRLALAQTLFLRGLTREEVFEQLTTELSKIRGRDSEWVYGRCQVIVAQALRGLANNGFDPGPLTRLRRYRKKA